MAASPSWYYRAPHGAFGPVTAATLKRFVEQGTIDPTTPIRRGEDGPWFPAERIYDALIPVAEAEPIEASDRRGRESPGPVVASGDEADEWHFSREDKRKLGPVPRSVMLAMAARRKLKPTDLVWKAGMASWVPAAERPELTGAFSAATVPTEPRRKDRAGRRSRSLTRAICAAVIALLALMTTALWTWMRSDRGRDAADRVELSTDTRAIPGPGSAPGQEATRPEHQAPGEDPEHLFADALAALRGGNLNRAGSLLNQYLSRPEARKQVEAARVLLHEIDLATSTAQADALAQRLGDQEINGYLTTGVQPLVDRSVQTPELRRFYRGTLLQALRQERNRRQSAQKAGVALAQGPQDQGQPAPAAIAVIPPDDDDHDADRPGSSSLLGSDDAVAAGPGKPAKRRDDNQPAGRPDRKDAITIETILESPESIEGRTLTLDGLYKVGTKVTLLKGPDENTVGWCLPVGGDDDRLICPGDAKVVGRDRYLILDGGLAPLLLDVLDQLKFRPAARPTYKCTLTVTVRPVIVNGARAPVVQIVGLEILGICDFVKVAQRRYEKAFWTVRVTPQRAWVAYGDGPSWVERLGGEERFVKPLRRKLRDLERRIIADRNSALVGRALQAALGSAVNMAIANQQQHARFTAAFLGIR